MTPPSITQELQASLRQAIDDTRRRRHEYLTLEHLLLALLDNPSVMDLLRDLEVDRDALRQELESFLAESLETVPVGVDYTPHETPGIQRVLQRAAVHALNAERPTIDGPAVLVAFFRDRKLLTEVDGVGAPDDVTERLITAIEANRRA